MAASFLLVNADGDTLALPWIETVSGETPARDVSYFRPPGGTAIFTEGDGGLQPAPLALTGTLRGTGNEPTEDVIRQYRELEGFLENAVSLRWTPHGITYSLALTAGRSFAQHSPHSGAPSLAFLRRVTLTLAPGSDGREWRDTDTDALAGVLL